MVNRLNSSTRSSSSASAHSDSAQSTPTKKRTPKPTPNIVLGMLIQIARRYLFLNSKKKAMFYLSYVLILSMLGSWLNLSYEDSTWVHKRSVFNMYGVKLGWFWTCIIVGPFIWYSAKLHHRDTDHVIAECLRVVVATAVWYGVVALFHRITAVTSRCDKSYAYSREQCSQNGGAWIPGYDFSGHCFLMIYSALIISEESNSFRQIQQVDAKSPAERVQFELDLFVTQLAFVAMLVLNLFWDFQILISCLYYHIFIDKICGALFAVVAWFLTYHGLYQIGFLKPPICRMRTV